MTAPHAPAPVERIARSLAPLGEWRLIRALPGGNASDSWLVDAEGGRLVVRADRPLARTLGLDRAAEWHILRSVSAAGLGPRPVLRDSEHGVLVTEYLPGTVWTGDTLKQDSKLAALGRRLRALHALPSVGDPFDPAAVAERYARAAGPGNGPPVAAIRALAEALYEPGAARCICHHDAHAGNVVTGADGGLRFIDWEYAAAGDPMFDLAVIVRYHDLAPPAVRRLLEGWSGGREPVLEERLQAFGRLYDALAALWEAVVANRGR